MVRPLEITVSVFVMTTNQDKALRVSEALQRVAAGLALEGDINVMLRMSAEEIEEDPP
jgi:hypothetical protein